MSWQFPPQYQELFSVGSYWKTKILLTSLKLGVYARLAGGPKSAAELAEELQGDPSAFKIFLNALTAMRLLRKDGEIFAVEAAARQFLVPDSPDYVGHQLLVDERCWDLWGKLEETLMAGRSPLPATIFFADPQCADHLIRGLHRDALRIAPKLAQQIDLTGCHTLLDVGGGAGTYAVFLCQANPQLKATVFELPNTAKITDQILREFNMEERVEVMCGDFITDPLPAPQDAIFLSNVLHGHGADTNRLLLKKIHGSLAGGGCLIIRDVLMDADGTAPSWGAIFSVNLLLHTGVGRCYPAEEINRWLAEAEFASIQRPAVTTPEWDPCGVILAHKV